MCTRCRPEQVAGTILPFPSGCRSLQTYWKSRPETPPETAARPKDDAVHPQDYSRRRRPIGRQSASTRRPTLQTTPARLPRSGWSQFAFFLIPSCLLFSICDDLCPLLLIKDGASPISCQHPITSIRSVLALAKAHYVPANSDKWGATRGHSGIRSALLSPHLCRPWSASPDNGLGQTCR